MLGPRQTESGHAPRSRAHRTTIAEARMWLQVKRHHGGDAVNGHGMLALSPVFLWGVEVMAGGERKDGC